MLGDADAIATVGVKDLDAARKFYGEKLGLEETPSDEASVLTYKSGNSVILVYTSQFAGTNQATGITWAVADVASVVRDLKAKGLAFEHYQMPGMTMDGDVHVGGKRKAAWLKDPDGNILAIVNQ